MYVNYMTPLINNIREGKRMSMAENQDDDYMNTKYSGSN